MVSDWRTHIQRQMNDVDNKAIGRAVDFLLNYETVKYFGAEDREAARYEEAVGAFARASVRNEVSLAWLNIGQSLITNLMMAGAMVFTVWGWSRGRFTAGDVVWINGLLMQLFRPLDMLGWVYRSIRQGLIDMEAMWDLLDTPAEVVDKPGAPVLVVRRAAIRFDNVHFGYDPGREILKGLDIDIPAGYELRDRRAVGRWQIDHRPPALPLLRPAARTHTDRRPGRGGCQSAEPPSGDRDRSSGHRAVQRHDRLQHRLRPRGSEPIRDRKRSARGRDRPVRRGFARQI